MGWMRHGDCLIERVHGYRAANTGTRYSPQQSRTVIHSRLALTRRILGLCRGLCFRVGGRGQHTAAHGWCHRYRVVVLLHPLGGNCAWGLAGVVLRLSASAAGVRPQSDAPAPSPSPGLPSEPRARVPVPAQPPRRPQPSTLPPSTFTLTHMLYPARFMYSLMSLGRETRCQSKNSPRGRRAARRVLLSDCMCCCAVERYPTMSIVGDVVWG